MERDNLELALGSLINSKINIALKTADAHRPNKTQAIFWKRTAGQKATFFYGTEPSVDREACATTLCGSLKTPDLRQGHPKFYEFSGFTNETVSVASKDSISPFFPQSETSYHRRDAYEARLSRPLNAASRNVTRCHGPHARAGGCTGTSG